MRWAPLLKSISEQDSPSQSSNPSSSAIESSHSKVDSFKLRQDLLKRDQIKEAQALGILDGVTTNPSLMAKEGITGEANILKHYVDICNIVEGDVSAEVISTNFEGMIKELIEHHTIG